MLEYNYKTVHNIIGESNNDLIKEWRKKWGYFPSFPNVKLIIALSAQMYEKQACYSNLAFLPDQFKRHISYVLKYKNHLTFDTNNLRFIRKMLESVDEKHCLVFQKERGLLKAVGIASLEYVTAHLIPIIKVRGHMLWQAEIRGRPLFEYRNGNFGFVVPNYNIDSFRESFLKAFGKFDGYENKLELFNCILSTVSSLHHGTSVIICENDFCIAEVSRLTPPKVGHGIALYQKIDFENLDEEKRISLLSQITRIDGGLLFNQFGSCLAFGCVFDGAIPLGYNGGHSGRGSRFNSIKLYVETQRKKNKCIGVIVSDDGSVDIV